MKDFAILNTKNKERGTLFDLEKDGTNPRASELYLFHCRGLSKHLGKRKAVFIGLALLGLS